MTKDELRADWSYKTDSAKIFFSLNVKDNPREGTWFVVEQTWATTQYKEKEIILNISTSAAVPYSDSL